MIQQSKPHGEFNILNLKFINIFAKMASLVLIIMLIGDVTERRTKQQTWIDGGRVG